MCERHVLLLQDGRFTAQTEQAQIGSSVSVFAAGVGCGEGGVKKVRLVQETLKGKIVFEIGRVGSVVLGSVVVFVFRFCSWFGSYRGCQIGGGWFGRLGQVSDEK